MSALYKALVVAAFFVVGWSYCKGLDGTFQLDDGENLKQLADIPPGLGWHERLSYGLAQSSGATRFLPQLSFVLQAASWPEQPGDMIAANIVLHLANGILVYLLGLKLAGLTRLARPEWIGLLAAAVWLSTPLHVSGVLYVIQRINLMSAFFVFGGAWCYLHGRGRLDAGGMAPVLWMCAGVIGGGGMAVLCKENGALLPVLLLAAELSLLPTPKKPSMRRFRLALLIAPMLLLVAALVWMMPQVLSGYAKRDFGLAERMLTEPLILLDYLGRFLIPNGAGLGLFHDDYPVSHWPPDGSTALAGVAWMAVIVVASLARRRWSAFTFGVYWYLGGHLLESTFIPLELYFEHRNYVPLFGPAFFLATMLVGGYDRANRASKRALVLLAGGWMLAMAATTHVQATLWGRPAALLETWSREHPESPRANGWMAANLAEHGDAEGALARIDKLIHGNRPRPEYVGLWVLLSCDGRLPPPSLQETAMIYAALPYSPIPENSLAAVADRMHEGRCPRVDPVAMVSLSESLLANPSYSDYRHRVLTLQGRFLELAGRYEEALVAIREGYRRNGDPELGFIEVRLLYTLGRRGEAERRLNEIDRYIGAAGVKFARYKHAIDNWRNHLSMTGKSNGSP